MTNEELNKVLAQADLEYETVKDKAREYDELTKSALKLNEIAKEQNKEIERLNNIIKGIDEILKEHIIECRQELNTIMKSDDLNYINECSREFNVIRKNIEMIIEKVEELKGSDKE